MVELTPCPYIKIKRGKLTSQNQYFQNLSENDEELNEVQGEIECNNEFR